MGPAPKTSCIVYLFIGYLLLW